MRKFKLIKEYGGSPQLGTEVNKCNDFPNYNFNGGNYTTVITAYFVENSPEFWEEVKEKFPKIISFRKISDKTLYTLGRYDLYWGKEVIGGYTLDVMITQGKNTNYTEIYQVAVSEAEVFTLGDKVKYYGEICNITEIYFNEHNQLSFRTNVKSLTVPKTGVFDLDVRYNKIKKAPEVLSITEYKVEIFEGDEYWFYWVDSPAQRQVVNVPYVVDKAERLEDDCKYSSSAKFFSTKEAAEHFISENKPIYSKKQIKEAVESSFVRENYTLEVPCCCADRFKEEIFKQKLNL